MSTFRKFLKLEPAVCHVLAAASRVIIAEDHLNTKRNVIVKHWLVFESEAAKYEYTHDGAPRKRHYYEVLLEKRPVHEVYDIDIKITDENKHMTARMAFDQFCEARERSFGACDPDDFRVLDSSSAEKISLHIINIKRTFSSVEVLKLWYKCFDTDLIDKCIARKNGALRMLDSCKWGSDRVLKKAEWHAPSAAAPDYEFYATRIHPDAIMCNIDQIPRAPIAEKAARCVAAPHTPSDDIESISHLMLEYIIDALPHDYCQYDRERWINGVYICARYGHLDLAHKLAQKSATRYSVKATDELYDHASQKSGISLSFRTLLLGVKNSMEAAEYKEFINNMTCDYITYTKLTRATTKVNMARVDLTAPEFKNAPTKMLKSNLMSFKSSSIGQAINENPNRSVLWITNRVLLAKDIKHEKFANLNFRLYNDDAIKENNGQINAEKNPRLVVQLNSIYLIMGKYDLVILDEIESIVEILIQFTDRKCECFNVLKDLIKSADSLIACDATLSDASCELITSLRADTKTVIIDNEYQSMKGREAVIEHVSDTGTFLEYVKARLLEGKRLVVPTNSKKVARQVEIMAREIFGAESNKVGAYYQGTEPCTVSDWRGKNLIVYSPSITTGLSFNEEWFSETVGFFTNNSARAETTLQMLFRVRNTESNILRIFYKHKYVDAAGLALTPAEVEKQTLSNLDARRDGLIKIKMTSMEVKRNLYYRMYEYHTIRKNKSKLEHIPILRGLLEQHGITTTVIKSKPTEDETKTRRKLDDKLDELDDENYKQIAECELIDDNDYDYLCKKETYTRLTDEERHQVIKRFIYNSVKPDKWSPEFVKFMCEKNFRALHAYKTALNMINRENDGTLAEYIEGGRREHIEALNRAHVRGQEDGCHDECVIQLIHKKDDFLRMQIARDLILAAGFNGCNDARHIELNLESMRKYMVDNESNIKSIWPRSTLKDLNNNAVLLKTTNNKLKKCGFQLIKSSNKAKKYKLKLYNRATLIRHGIKP